MPLTKKSHQQAISRCLSSYQDNPFGFHNDVADSAGRYDIYSVDLILFLAPLWKEIGLEETLTIFQRQWDVVQAGVHENGAAIVWGRSTGVLLSV